MCDFLWTVGPSFAGNESVSTLCDIDKEVCMKVCSSADMRPLAAADIIIHFSPPGTLTPLSF